PEVRRGAERIVEETARALGRHGHDVTVLTSGAHASDAQSNDHRTIRLRRRHADSARHERWFANAVMPRLVAGRFDVVHSLFPRDALAAVRTRRMGGHRVVYEELGIPFRWWWQQEPDREIRLRLVDQVDDYGCMSRAALRALHRDHGRSGVLIPGGVRLDQFTTARTREPYPTVLFSGTLTDHGKGLWLLAQAFNLVLREEPNAQLWLSGPGDPAEELADASPAVRARTVHLELGEPGEQGARYGRAWTTALPSRGDSFGMVLIESLASGTPIVVGDDAAPPELVRPGIGV